MYKVGDKVTIQRSGFTVMNGLYGLKAEVIEVDLDADQVRVRIPAKGDACYWLWLREVKPCKKSR